MVDEVRYDMLEIGKATVDHHGWLRDTPVLTRAGVFDYREKDGTLRREYRPAEVVFEPESLASLRGIPIVIGHNGLITEENADEHEVVGSVASEGRQDGDNLLGDVVVHNRKKVGLLRELSLGYTITLDRTPGEFNGQKYDVKQTKVRYNHLAFVKKGRAGNARLRLDSADAVHGNFEQEDEPPMADKLTAIRLDGLEYQGSPEVARHIAKLGEDNAALQKRFDGLEAERDKLKKDAEEHAKALDKVREDAATTLRARIELEGVAKAHGVKVEAKDTDRAIREKVLYKLTKGADARFDGKSDTYIDVAYDMAIAEADKTSKPPAKNARAEMNGAREDGDDDIGTLPGATRQDGATKLNGAADFRKKMLAGLNKSPSASKR